MEIVERVVMALCGIFDKAENLRDFMGVCKSLNLYTIKNKTGWPQVYGWRGVVACSLVDVLYIGSC